MSLFYIDTARGADPWSLPNGEAFYAEQGEWFANECGERCDANSEAAEPNEAGWYWWACFPGCMPDSEPCGPFATEQDAIDNARESYSE